jgi:hypothetical protein
VIPIVDPPLNVCDQFGSVAAAGYGTFSKVEVRIEAGGPPVGAGAAGGGAGGARTLTG